MKILTRRLTDAGRQRGFSLIELMIAVGLGAVLLLGMTTLFSGVKLTFNENDSLSRLQENGRFAIARLTQDIRMSAFRYCSSFLPKAGKPNLPPSPRVISSEPLDGIRAGSTDTTTIYALNDDFFLRGFECDFAGTGVCDTDPLPDYLGIPAQGTGDGERVHGSDVLNIRYLAPPGALLSNDMGSNVASIQVPTEFSDTVDDGDTLLVADCEAMDVFTVTGVGSGGLLQHGGSSNFGASGGDQAPLSRAYRRTDQSRVFRLSDVTYYLRYRVIDGQPIPTLRRVLNGQDQELVVGVERLDFTYGVETDILDDAVADDVLTDLVFMSAAEIEAESVGVCGTDGCLWDQISSIAMNMLVSSDSPLSSENLPFRYAAHNPAAPTAELVPPAGVPRCNAPGSSFSCTDNPDRYIRREFSALISIRNFNQ